MAIFAASSALAAPLNVVQPANSSFVNTVGITVDYQLSVIPAGASGLGLDPSQHGLLTISGDNKSQFVTITPGSWIGVGDVDAQIILQHSDANGPLVTPIAIWGSLFVKGEVFFSPDNSLGGQTFYDAPKLFETTTSAGGLFGYDSEGTLEAAFRQSGDIADFAFDRAPVYLLAPNIIHSANSSGTQGTFIDFTDPAVFTQNFNGTGKVDTFSAIPTPSTLVVLVVGGAAMLARPYRKHLAKRRETQS